MEDRTEKKSVSGMCIFSEEDPDYPQRLRPYKGMPKRLYCLGKLPEDRPSVAIVGARQCDYYGHMTERGNSLVCSDEKCGYREPNKNSEN